jgi:hypothetical protein
MTRWTSTAILAIAALGCVRVEYPLSEAADVITDDNIVGTWQHQDAIFGPSKDDVEIIALKDGLYRWTDGDAHYDFRIVRAAGANYLEVCLLTQSREEDELLAPMTCFPIRWERRGDWMKLEYPSNLEKFVGEGKALTGTISSGHWCSTGTITSSAAELDAFLTEHADDVYCQKSVYRRVASTKAMQNEGDLD